MLGYGVSVVVPKPRKKARVRAPVENMDELVDAVIVAIVEGKAMSLTEDQALRFSWFVRGRPADEAWCRA